MPREIVLGNGQLAAALDSQMRIRDFFFPHVGLENHLGGHPIRLGAWTDNKFSWVGDNWEITLKYLPETLVSQCYAKTRGLKLELEINDAVHHFLNLYLRKIVVNNNSNDSREIRFFFSQDFHIYGEEAGDTALYEPALNALIHYKRRRYFLINGETDRKDGMHQFSTGYKESVGREGTWKDAEDGRLEQNPVAQGAVDSVAAFKIQTEPQEARTVYYWIAVGKDVQEVKTLDAKVKTAGVEQMLLETENYWSAWVNKQDVNLTPLPRDLVRLFKTSLLIMRTLVGNNGAIIASCDSDVLQFNRDTYSYVWPRDGAMATMAFDNAGFREASRSFFLFCNRTISDDGYFRHKYAADGSVGSSWHPLIDSKGTPQLPLQEDETALVLYALWKHFQKYRDVEFIEKVYHNLVIKATDFLLNYIDTGTGLPKPSFDLWEEKTGTFTSTSAATCAALNSAAKFAQVFYDSERKETLVNTANRMKQAMLTHLYDRELGRFIKAVYPDGTRDPTVDSSLAFIFTCETFDAKDDVVKNTMNEITRKLWVQTDIGGAARYENDEYYRATRNVPGNPWFISTLWIARWHIAQAESLDQLKKGFDLLSWTAKRALPSGVLAEQLNPHTGKPISVSPLVWSHAEFVLATCEYLQKYNEVTSRTSDTRNTQP